MKIKALISCKVIAHLICNFVLAHGKSGFSRDTAHKILYSNRYIVQVKFYVHFLPCMKNVPKPIKMHINKMGLTKTEFCKSHIQLRQPPISCKFCCFSAFCNTGVRVNVTARLYILCKYLHSIFRNKDINAYRVHMNDNTPNSDHPGISLSRILYLLFLITWFLF